MKLELILKWDEKIPFDKRDENLSQEQANGIEVVTKLSGFDPGLGFKKMYKGNLSTKESVEAYSSHLAWNIFGTGTPYVELVKKKTDHNSTLILSKLAKYDTERKGMKKASFSFRKIDDFEGFKRCLERIEKRWFIEPRKEWVNDCDYWDGFFGTSNGLWSGSIYPYGGPSEKARQFAYDLEQSIRNDKWSIWFFPGYIFCYPEDGFSRSERSVSSEINRLICDNSHLQNGKKLVIAGLRYYADKYDIIKSKEKYDKLREKLKKNCG